VKRRTRDDAGLTLAEMMVVMMLMGLLSALVLTFVTTVERQMTNSKITNENTNQASAATNEVTKLLRGAVNLKVKGQPVDAPAFVEAGPTSMTFYTVVDTDPTTTPPMLVRLEVTADGSLVEKRWLADPHSADPYWTFPSTAQTPDSTRTIAHAMTARPGSGKTLFTYLAYDTHGNQVAIAAAGSLSSTQRATVGAVRLDAQVQTGTRVEPSVITTVVGLRNLPTGSHG